MQKKDFLYFFPFFIFFISHILISELIFKKEKIKVEELKGRTLSEIVPWLKENNISIIISKIHNQINLKNEFIINQYPLKESNISAKSPIYLEINLLNFKEKNLSINNLNLKETINILLENGYSYQIIEIPSEKTFEKVIGSIKNGNCYFLYVLKKKEDYFIIDNFKNCSCQKLKNNLKNYKINFICLNHKNEIIEDVHDDFIKSQQPIPGSFIKNEKDIYLWH